MNQCKTARGAMKLISIFCALTLGCYIILMLLSCPSQEFAGVLTNSE